MTSLEAARRYRAYDCISCGHCTYSCPAAHGARRFSPRKFMEEFAVRGGSEGLDLWSCMGCARLHNDLPPGGGLPSLHARGAGGAQWHRRADTHPCWNRVRHPRPGCRRQRSWT
ncbi:MAG: hypothetical protein MZV70_01360 [Desulfobacterales bacterium]|nr:hypothetical protein [Desulfobacterales bacterium]